MRAEPTLTKPYGQTQPAVPWGRSQTAPTPVPRLPSATPRGSPYLPPMPEILQVRSPTQPNGAPRTPPDLTKHPTPQTDGPRINLPSQNAKPQLSTTSPLSKLSETQASTNQQRAGRQAPVTVRGRLDDSAEIRAAPITLPSPEALGLLRCELANAASSTVGREPSLSGGARPITLPDTSKARPAGQDAHGLDWIAVRRECERLGATSYRLEKLANGKWRFTFVLSSGSQQREREIEAVADSDADAVSAVLHHLRGNTATR